MKNRVIEIDEIKSYLPHRYPFLFVDRILEIHDDKIIGVKNVTANEEFFMGHFPKYPVMPGVLIIEALAQVAGVYTIIRNEEKGNNVKDMKTLFTSIDGAKFKRPVRPGDRLILEAKFIKSKLGVWWFDVQASVEGGIACKAQISAAFR